MDEMILNTTNEVKIDGATYVVERKMIGNEKLTDLIIRHVLEKIRKQ